jgi:hypothetical protein
MSIDQFHKEPCANCGHQQKHGEVSGCCANTAALGERARWCPCDTYVAPAKQTGRTIPARNTDPGTSHAATTYISIKANTQRAKLLAAFATKVDATDEEAMEAAEGVSPMSEFAKRCSELRAAGLIEMTGEVRSGQSGVDRIVSRITDAGHAALKGLGE